MGTIYLSTDTAAPNKRVLVVDDNPVNLKITAHLIRKAGFLTDTAETAEEALDRLASNRPDLVVTDLQLPGMDGLDLKRTLKENSAWRSIPVVLLTAAHSPEEEMKAREAGCECSIAKPVDSQMFPGVIQSFLGSAPAANVRDAELQGLPIEELRNEFLEGGASECRAILAQFGASRQFAPALDLVSLRKALHRWAGVGGTLGLPAITIHARHVEAFTTIPDHNLDVLHRKLAALLHEFTDPAPVAQSTAPRTRKITAVAADAPASAKPVILVADDDPTIRAVVRLALEAAGFECRLADDGVLTCSLARNTLPNAIVLDVNMPRMDGFQVMYCLRSLWSTRKIPVILLTARHDEDDIVRGAELGAAEYMTKPFEVSELVARLTRLTAPH